MISNSPAKLPELTDCSTRVQGELSTAIEHYHKALGLRPDDTFASEMLTQALQDEAVPQELEEEGVFG